MLKRDGYLTIEEIEKLPGFPSKETLKAKKCVVIECAENIPCNPCEASCPQGAIVVGDPITNLPQIKPEKCVACGLCIARCPGQAIFLVDCTGENTGTVAMPYEYVPVPERGQEVACMNREGAYVCQGTIEKVTLTKAYDRSTVVEVRVPIEKVIEVRSIRTDYSESVLQEKSKTIADIGSSDEDMLVCRCEEITRSEVIEAIRKGAQTSDDVKRLTRAGMGLCQGRNCRKTIERIIAEEMKKNVAEYPAASRRAPVRPLKMTVFTSQYEVE